MSFINSPTLYGSFIAYANTQPLIDSGGATLNLVESSGAVTEDTLGLIDYFVTQSGGYPISTLVLPDDCAIVSASFYITITAGDVGANYFNVGFYDESMDRVTEANFNSRLSPTLRYKGLFSAVDLLTSSLVMHAYADGVWSFTPAEIGVSLVIARPVAWIV